MNSTANTIKRRARVGSPGGLSRTAQAVFWIILAPGLLAQAGRDPVTLTYFRLGWSQPDELPAAETLSQRFVRETGIELRSLPVPETALDQLSLSRKLLEGGSGPDVLGVDLIWSGALEPDLIDLRPYLKDEIQLLAPQLLRDYVVNGRLVAVPYTQQIGVLEYRTDLLREYGYDHPPKTWDELESMAERIQKGERAKGNRNFWGYVWQGAPAESLTCNALEWQTAEGGGRIIESDRTVSVDNPAAIRSWQRARRWVGRISPPSVLSYRELDSINVFDSGDAAFNRVWGGGPVTRSGLSRQIHWRSSLSQGRTGYTSMPGGPDGWGGTLGGSGLAVSRHSTHLHEAIELVRFLLRAQIEANEEEEKAAPGQPERHGLPSVSGGDSSTAGPGKRGNSIVSRPSSVVGAKYEEVTKAYIDAVHSVLAGEKDAPEAASGLEKELIRITGFAAGPPNKDRRAARGK
jgi:trehalose/maltose transport system substrate-binding protein